MYDCRAHNSNIQQLDLHSLLSTSSGHAIWVQSSTEQRSKVGDHLCNRRAFPVMLSSATTVSWHYLQTQYWRSTANPWWVKEKEKRKPSVQTGNCVSFTGFLRVPSTKDGTIQIKRIFWSQRHIWFLLVRYESVGVGHDWCVERQLAWALREQISVLLPLHTRTQTALSKRDNRNSQKSWSFSVAGCLPKLSGISRAPVFPRRMCGVDAILALCNLKMFKKKPFIVSSSPARAVQLSSRDLPRWSE